jgi:lysophospholipase L1-like esterase
MSNADATAVALGLVLSLASAGLAGSSTIRRRGGLANCRVRFERGKTGHVAFMGGSITEMNGYRPMVCELLKKRFPDTAFTFTDAGISSTCSTTGAFRLERGVLSHGPVDLFFVEFAVNDDQDAAHSRAACIRGMEGIVRHTLRHNPAADIVFVYFVNPGMLKTYGKGETPLSIAAHEAVARHYGLSSIHLAREVFDRIQAGTLTWKDYGGVHPAPRGNRIAAEMIDELMSACWPEPLADDAKKVPQEVPEPLDPKSYARGRFISPAKAEVKSGWASRVPDWKSLKGHCRGRFAKKTLLCATKPGAELSLSFAGTAIGAYVLAGPDAGILEASIDGGEWRPVDLYHRFSRNLHYPRTVMFAAELKPGEHTLGLRTSAEANSASTGHAARILQFCAN